VLGLSLGPDQVERGQAFVRGVVDRAGEVARTSLDEAKGIAQSAYGQVKDELHRQTGPAGEGASLVEKAQAIAEAGTQAVREDLDSRLPH